MTHRLPDPMPTQTDRPWRATFRTVIVATIGLLPILPYIATSARIDTVPMVVTILGITTTIQRVISTPEVERWLEKFAPWIAADPSRKDSPDAHR